MNPIYFVPISSKSQKLSKFIPTPYIFVNALINITDFSGTKPRRLGFVFKSLECHRLFIIHVITHIAIFVNENSRIFIFIDTGFMSDEQYPCFVSIMTL